MITNNFPDHQKLTGAVFFLLVCKSTPAQTAKLFQQTCLMKHARILLHKSQIPSNKHQNEPPNRNKILTGDPEQLCLYINGTLHRCVIIMKYH